MYLRTQKKSIKRLIIIGLVVVFLFSVVKSEAKVLVQHGGSTKKSDFGHSEYEIPPAKISAYIKKSFYKIYPGITPDFWLLVEGNYQAQFEYKGKIKTAEFSPKGVWLSCETVVEVQDIPIKSAEYILKNFGGYEINIAILQETKDGNFFAIGIATDIDYQELIFDVNGEFLQFGDYID